MKYLYGSEVNKLIIAVEKRFQREIVLISIYVNDPGKLINKVIRVRTTKSQR